MKQLVPRNEKKNDNIVKDKNDKNDNPFNLPPYVEVPEFEDLDFEKLVDADNNCMINPVYAYNPEYNNVDFIKYLHKKRWVDMSKDEASFWLELSNYLQDAQLIRKIKWKLYRMGLLKVKARSKSNLKHRFVWNEDLKLYVDEITGKTYDELFKER